MTLFSIAGVDSVHCFFYFQVCAQDNAAPNSLSSDPASLFSPIVTATCRAGTMTIKVETLDKFAGVVGTFMMAWIGPLLGSSRYGVLSLLLLFGAGAWLLLRVRESVPCEDEAA